MTTLSSRGKPQRGPLPALLRARAGYGANQIFRRAHGSGRCRAVEERAVKHLRNQFSQAAARSAVVMLDLRREFPGQWTRFLNPVRAVFELELSPRRLPARDQKKTIKVHRIAVMASCSGAGTRRGAVAAASGSPRRRPRGSQEGSDSDEGRPYGALHVAEWTVLPTGPPMSIKQAVPAQTWRLKIDSAGG